MANKPKAKIPRPSKKENNPTTKTNLSEIQIRKAIQKHILSLTSIIIKQ